MLRTQTLRQIRKVLSITQVIQRPKNSTDSEKSTADHHDVGALVAELHAYSVLEMAVVFESALEALTRNLSR